MSKKLEIGLFRVMPTLHMRSGYDSYDLQVKALTNNNLFKVEGQNFCSNLSFFQYMFPFGHFAKIKGQFGEDGSVIITVQPILVRIIQLSVIVIYSFTLSAITLYDGKDWSAIGILALHFSVVCTVMFLLRIMYVADAKYKFYQVRKVLRLV